MLNKAFAAGLESKTGITAKPSIEVLSSRVLPLATAWQPTALPVT
jgi:hypothetical protein